MNQHDHRKAQVAHYDAQILQMKKMRNTFVPISLLPPEILTAIFLCYRDMCCNSQSTIGSPWSQWIGVSYVCTQWRDLALNNPLLWSRLSFTSWPQDPQILEISIQRSQNAPLWIYVSRHFSIMNHQTLIGLLKKSNRLQLLDMSVDHGPQGLIYLEKITGVAAPILQSLKLDTYGPPVDVPDLFSGGTPSLRHLDLSGFSVKPHPSLMTGLTSFHLQRDNLALNDVGDLHLFDALNYMGNLRELVLKISIFDPEPKPGQVVRLSPHLEKFAFEGSLKFLNVFLERLSIPLSASLYLDGLVFDLHQDIDHRPLFLNLAKSLASAWLSNPSCHPRFADSSTSNTERYSAPIICAEATDISDAGGDKFGFSGWLYDADFVHMPDDDPNYGKEHRPNLTITIWGLPSWMLVRYFLTTFPLNDVRSMYLDVQLRKKDLSILRRLPLLRSVMVSEECAADFLNYVINDPVMLRYQSRMRKKKMRQNDHERVCGPPKYFPNMVYLGFSEADFGLFDYELDGVEDEAIDMDVLLEYLAFRKHSVPIQKLRLEDCVNVIEEEVELMKENVEFIIWDERVRIKDDFDWLEERGVSSDGEEEDGDDDNDDEEHEDEY
ncbi:hypothetical protein BJ165DRAFT_1451175 [Panaeolus papilionaceus]|nr:hypothetical protein BJ165DRAFT_1451175 [Panaeolus papilionaceus]